LRVNTTIIARDWPMASRIAPAQLTPGWMSRGAIQQVMPLDSSPAQILSATGLSLVEYEIKTSCAMDSPGVLNQLD
jgi:hypothetical protein